MLATADNAHAREDKPALDDLQSEHVVLWLWAIVIAGLVLRLIALGYKSLWIDEIASVAIARRASPAFWHFLWHDEGNMAAYYVLLRPWLHFGYGEAAVRSLSVIPGVLSIPLMYPLGRKLFGQRTAVLATLFLALNACAIFVSQEARAYSFVVMVVLLSTYLFVRMIEAPGYGAACTYAVVAGMSCYFHYFCVLVPVAQYAAVVGMRPQRRPWKPLFLAAIIIAVLAMPVLWLIHAQDTGHISWVQPPSWLEMYHLGAYLAAASGKSVGGVLLALNLVLAGFFVKRLRNAWRDFDLRWRYLLVASLIATPIVITLLVSLVRPAFYHRFLVICLPGWVLMMALGTMEIPVRVWRASAIVAVCGLSIASTVILYHRVTEDWRGAVEYLITNAGPGDRVLYYQSVGEFAGENYRDWLPGGGRERPMSVPVNADGAWEQTLDDAQQVWLVLYRAKPEDAEARKIEKKLESRYQAGAKESFRGVTVIRYGSGN